jgi:beta-glucanase (GH16 family)
VVIAATAWSVPGGLRSSAAQGGWKLAFQDDFRGHSLNTKVWRTCFWWATTTCSIDPNHELELYNPSDVSVSGGVLQLRARKHSMVGWNGRTYSYTSGMVMSGGRAGQRPGFAFTYGKAVARVKVPKGAGLLPAFWLLPASGASRPEIDAMEILGSSPNIDRMHIHYVGAGGRPVGAGASWTGGDFSAGWHTFAVDWEPNGIVWSVDGVARWRVTDRAAIPNQPMYLLLTLAVGGDFPGAPTASTAFPSSLQVKYVRVWQHPS